MNPVIGSIENIESTIQLLEALSSDTPETPEVTAFSQGALIAGNRSGYLRLAISVLRAAQGQTQCIDGQSWQTQTVAPWGERPIGLRQQALLIVRPSTAPWRPSWRDLAASAVLVTGAAGVIAAIALGLRALLS
jgi:hypothetical protein